MRDIHVTVDPDVRIRFTHQRTEVRSGSLLNFRGTIQQREAFKHFYICLYLEHDVSYTYPRIRVVLSANQNSDRPGHLVAFRSKTEERESGGKVGVELLVTRFSHHVIAVEGPTFVLRTPIGYTQYSSAIIVDYHRLDTAVSAEWWNHLPHGKERVRMCTVPSYTMYDLWKQLNDNRLNWLAEQSARRADRRRRVAKAEKTLETLEATLAVTTTARKALRRGTPGAVEEAMEAVALLQGEKVVRFGEWKAVRPYTGAKFGAGALSEKSGGRGIRVKFEAGKPVKPDAAGGFGKPTQAGEVVGVKKTVRFEDCKLEGPGAAGEIDKALVAGKSGGRSIRVKFEAGKPVKPDAAGGFEKTMPAGEVVGVKKTVRFEDCNLEGHGAAGDFSKPAVRGIRVKFEAGRTTKGAEVKKVVRFDDCKLVRLGADGELGNAEVAAESGGCGKSVRFKAWKAVKPEAADEVGKTAVPEEPGETLIAGKAEEGRKAVDARKAPKAKEAGEAGRVAGARKRGKYKFFPPDILAYL